ncbi:acyl carrier protein [Brevibacillus brevis X23]|nr:acyl carrier protein [Brevibacillus brevis X23]
MNLLERLSTIIIEESEGRVDKDSVIFGHEDIVNDLGYDSLMIVKLFLRIEEEFQIEITEYDPSLFIVDTLAQYIQQEKDYV